MDYMTEDNVVVSTGTVVYNYYDMDLGTIAEDHGCDYPHRELEDPNKKRWFYFAPTDGTQGTLLNGERVCTLDFARRRGFPLKENV